MHLPVRPLATAWPTPLVRRLRRWFWSDPRVVLDPDLDGEDAAADYRRAMSALHVGNTIKITGTDRHPEADDLLLGLDDATLGAAHIVDIGASDGSTSVDLVRRLPAFASFVIADLYLEISAARTGRHTVFFAPEGEPILVVGDRVMAWPGESSLVRVLYSRILVRARRVVDRQTVLLLNPSARQLLAADPRVSYRQHDVFEPWPGRQPTIVKVANLLRRLYFGDDDITRALGSILASLPVCGHLLVVDNPRMEGVDERSGLYRRDPDGFTPVAYASHRPEIDDLVLAVRQNVPSQRRPTA